MTTSVFIDHSHDTFISHDTFTITRSHDAIEIQLRSRGSFTVTVHLSVEDGRAFAAALLKETSG